MIQHYIRSTGHNCMFFPKFHCEHNPIERVWGQAKSFTRAFCKYSIVGLRKTIAPALDTVTVDLIRKYFRKARNYIHAYREGKAAGQEVEIAVKHYKCHRRILKDK